MTSKLCMQSKLCGYAFTANRALRTSASQTGVGEPMPVPSQIVATPSSKQIPIKCFADKSASAMRHQSRTVCGVTPRTFASFETVDPAHVIDMRNRSPKVSTRSPCNFYRGINVAHACRLDAGLTARLCGKKLPRRPEYFRGRGFFHSPKMMCIRSAPVDCAMHASMTAKRGASFNANSLRMVRALTLQSAAASEARMPASFITSANRVPNAVGMRTQYFFRPNSPMLILVNKKQ